MIIQPKFLRSAQPLAEYPRPQFQRNSYLSLNGEWDIAFLSESAFDKGYKSVPKTFEQKIIVPFSPESPYSGVNRQLQNNETLCYRTWFSFPPGFKRGKILLNFGAVDQVCKVYCNSGLVGTHEGGYLPFSLDITKYYRHGKQNELVVLVKDDASSSIYGRGKQAYQSGGIWYTATSGIWQSVWAECVPYNYLTSVALTPNAEKKEITITPRNSDRDKQVLTVRIYDGEKLLKTVNLWTEKTQTIKVPFCKLWTMDSPELYTIRYTMGEDDVISYFGLRDLSIKKKKRTRLLSLNGEPTFFNGLLDQGYYGDGYYTPSNNFEVYDRLCKVKDLGFNMLRKHIKVEPMLFYHYCDCLGIAIFQDMVNGGKKYKDIYLKIGPFVKLNLNDKNYKARGREEEASREQFYQETVGTVETLYNSPCVVEWTLFNECWGQFDAKELGKELKSLDPTRFVDPASGWCDKRCGDLYSRHIYFRKLRLKSDNRRALALTEFGGYSLKRKGEKKFGYKMFDSARKYNEAYKDLYRNQVIPAVYEGLCVTVYTQLNDVEEECNGIFTEKGELKLVQDDVIAVNAELYSAFKEEWNK